MRSYRRKFMKNALNDATNLKVETRDAILWYIDSDSMCRVKIQGSDNLVTCHYPRNQKDKPYWLRVGNAVRITHRSGVRGYVEVVGEGRAIPQPILGGAMPPSGTTADGIITGMVVSETSPPSNSVVIADGTYRINEIIYNYTGQGSGYIIMDDPPPMVMGDAPVSEMGVPTFPLADAPPDDGYFRYDAVVIGSNRVVDYITGVAVTSDPSYPEIPADHILLSYILRVGGDEDIPNERIGIEWTVPKASYATMSMPDIFPWDNFDDTPEISMTVNIFDQYGSAFRTPSTGWVIDVMKVGGEGNMYSTYSGYNETTVEQPLINGTYATFKYERNQLGVEIKPFFFATVHGDTPIQAFADWMELEII